MKKEKNILITFSLYVLFCISIMFWGITHPAAASYNYSEFIAQLYDNYGPTLSAVTTNQTNNRWEGTIPDMTAYSSGAAWGISSPVVLIAGHTYSLTAKITGYYGGNIVKSTYDRIGVGDTLNNARISYQNNSNVNELYSSAPQTYGLIQFAFTTNVNGNYIVFPFATSYTGSNQTFWLENIVIDDLGASGVSQSQITNSLNNQTNTINNSITASENNIKSNSNKNKQEIIDNQNENAKETQDAINNNLANVCSNLINPPKFNVCTFSNYSDTLNNCNVNIIDTNINAGYVQYSSNASWNGVHSDYMPVNVYTSYTLSFYNMSYQNTGVICPKVNFYNSNKQFLSQDVTCFSTQYVSKTYTTPYNASYARISFDTEQPYSEITIDKITFSENGTFCPYGSTTSKLDEAENTRKGILGRIGDILSYINPLSDNFFAYKLIELLGELLKSLFVPTQQELTDLIDNFKSTMETKLGAIYQVADLLVSVLRSVLSPANSNSCMTFPEIKDPMFDKLLIEQTDYCFDSLRADFGFVFTLSDMIISIVCTLAFANMLYKKYEGFIGGNSNDY